MKETRKHIQNQFIGLETNSRTTTNGEIKTRSTSENKKSGN